jgi:acyl carrier protein phosphodiesterase
MNWLAHLLLSEPDVESRLGNLLADLLKGTERQNLSVNIQQGIEFHRLMDAFTDCHVCVQRSKQRIHTKYRRFAGIFVDVFYDHFLAKNWANYSPQPLEKFTAEVYESFKIHPVKLPLAVSQLITRMVDEDWLGGYRHLDGVENAAVRLSKRLSMRFKKPFQLDAVSELIANYGDLENDFLEFFPELLKYAQTVCHRI